MRARVFICVCARISGYVAPRDGPITVFCRDLYYMKESYSVGRKGSYTVGLLPKQTVILYVKKRPISS